MAPCTSQTQAVSTWLSSFGVALDSGDFDAALSLFGQDCYWRDFVSFTWNIKTAEGKDEIRAMLEATVPQACPTKWQIEGDAMDMYGATNAFISFETGVARCRGHVRLKDGKCFTLFTQIKELKGFEEKLGTRRLAEFTVPLGGESWGEHTARERAELGHSKQPFVVVVGSGHCGIMLAARLEKLGVPTILLDKNASPGDTWRHRYALLKLHTTSIADTFPYLSYSEGLAAVPRQSEQNCSILLPLIPLIPLSVL